MSKKTKDPSYIIDKTGVTFCGGCGGSCPKMTTNPDGSHTLTDDFGGKVKLSAAEFNALGQYARDYMMKSANTAAGSDAA